MQTTTMRLIVLCWLVIMQMDGWSQQCAPALPDCATCTPLSQNNQNISSGIRCVTTSIQNLNLSGTGVICISGAGALVNANINGGTVIFNGSSASNPLGVNVNGGTLRIRSSLTATNISTINSGTLIVENGATLTVNNLTVNSTLIVEQGSTLFVNQQFVVNGNGRICMNNGIINTNTFPTNDAQNGTTTPSRGCIAIRGTASSFNQNLTNSSNIFVCLSGTTPSPNRFGSATINQNCAASSNGCQAALPVRLTSFQAHPTDTGIQLTWTSSLEQNFDYYQVERSTNAVSFEAVSPRINGLVNQSGLRSYAWIDPTVGGGTYYYRLKQVDLDKTFAYSKIVSVAFDDSSNEVVVSPNPVSDGLTISLNTPNEGRYVVAIYSAAGKLLTTQTGDKSSAPVSQVIPTDALPTGLYIVSVQIGSQHFIRKIVRE